MTLTGLVHATAGTRLIPFRRVHGHQRAHLGFEGLVFAWKMCVGSLRTRWAKWVHKIVVPLYPEFLQLRNNGPLRSEWFFYYFQATLQILFALFKPGRPPPAAPPHAPVAGGSCIVIKSPMHCEMNFWTAKPPGKGQFSFQEDKRRILGGFQKLIRTPGPVFSGTDGEGMPSDPSRASPWWLIILFTTLILVLLVSLQCNDLNKGKWAAVVMCGILYQRVGLFSWQEPASPAPDQVRLHQLPTAFESAEVLPQRSVSECSR